MYLLRRVWDVEPVNTRMAATLAAVSGPAVRQLMSRKLVGTSRTLETKSIIMTIVKTEAGL